MSTLQVVSTSRNHRDSHILLGIICRVREDARINTPPDLVITVHLDSVRVRMHELLVQDEAPNTMEELATTMGEERRCRPYPMLGEEVPERIWNLKQDGSMSFGHKAE